MGDKPARPIIGWREWVALPELGIKSIKAKVDTGARSSALHAYDIELFKRGRKQRVRFKVHPLQRDSKKTISVEAPVFELERQVRNSGGAVQSRIVIAVPVRLFGELFPIELTLTRRDTMGFRLLLGRQAVRGRFLIDPGRSFLAGGKPKKAKKR